MEELEGQRSICRTTLQRAVAAESQVKDMKQRSSGLEGELLSSDVERDQLREDRRKVGEVNPNYFRSKPWQLHFITVIKIYQRAISNDPMSYRHHDIDHTAHDIHGLE